MTTNIIINQIKNEMTYNNTVVFTYTINYPQIKDTKNAEHTFNTYYKTRALEYEQHCKDYLYPLAVEDYKNSIQHGYPVHIYEAVKACTITFNCNRIVSLYSDTYEYAGGAHGNTIRDSQTWDLQYAYERIVALYELFWNTSYVIEILKIINAEISAQIKTGENQYFENYCQLVIDYFNENNFFLKPKSVIVYYQQYEIAPYVSGIPEFVIPLS